MWETEHSWAPSRSPASRGKGAPQCNRCQKSMRESESGVLFPCPRCRIISYCSQDCMEKDSDAHSSSCALPAYLSMFPPPCRNKHNKNHLLFCSGKKNTLQNPACLKSKYFPHCQQCLAPPFILETMKF